VPECDLNWISDEMCVWIPSCPAAMGELMLAHPLLLYD
jgi:hypothetical protein